ncbi:MAG TPA: hypothetical protein VHL53_10810 [Acidimicrobiia bacterium]|nr:hypothetical protein [Acidimicrobiia bacterium]
MKRAVLVALLVGGAVVGAPTAAFARHNHCRYGWDNWGYDERGSHYHYGSWYYDRGPQRCRASGR